MKLNFSGNRALITGGTSELAIYIAKYMIGSGLLPFLTYRNEKGERNIIKSLNSHKDLFKTIYLNYNDAESLKNLFQELNNDIDYLVDIAHTDFEKYIASANDKDIDTYFNENIIFRGKLVKAASRAMMRKKKGRLIYISSIAVTRTNPGQGFYAASKLASEALYRNTGIELGGNGITAITLRTGFINSGRGKRYIEEKDKKMAEKIPTERILTCEEVAETVLFLMSESAVGFNATEITLDGGYSSVK